MGLVYRGGVRTRPLYGREGGRKGTTEGSGPYLPPSHTGQVRTSPPMEGVRYPPPTIQVRNPPPEGTGPYPMKTSGVECFRDSAKHTSKCLH